MMSVSSIPNGNSNGHVVAYLAHLGYYLSSPDSKKQGIKHRDYNSHPGRDLPTMVFDIYIYICMQET